MFPTITLKKHETTLNLNPNTKTQEYNNFLMNIGIVKDKLIFENGFNRLTDCPKKVRIFTQNLVERKSDPGTPKGFDDWKVMQPGVGKPANLLSEPSNKKGKNRPALTQMHAINSNIGADETVNNNPKNIFLGTIAANGNHKRQVEEPIKNFLTEHINEEEHYVDYTVEPQYNGPPPEIKARAEKITDPDKRNEFIEWTKQAIPTKVVCDVKFYKLDTAHSNADANALAQKDDVETLPSPAKKLKPDNSQG